MTMASTTASELYEKAMALPEEERRELYEALGESLYPENDTSDEMLEKIQARLARIDRGEAKVLSSTEAKERLRRHLSRRK